MKNMIKNDVHLLLFVRGTNNESSEPQKPTTYMPNHRLHNHLVLTPLCLFHFARKG